jgi:hypothetical protein
MARSSHFARVSRGPGFRVLAASPLSQASAGSNPSLARPCKPLGVRSDHLLRLTVELATQPYRQVRMPFLTIAGVLSPPSQPISRKLLPNGLSLSWPFGSSSLFPNIKVIRRTCVGC